MTKVTISISVTQEEIDQGQLYDCHRCPVARAIGRRFPKSEGITVGPSFLTIGSEITETPIEVADFIQSFDQRLKVNPFVFTIEVPSWFSGQGYR